MIFFITFFFIGYIIGTRNARMNKTAIMKMRIADPIRKNGFLISPVNGS